MLTQKKSVLKYRVSKKDYKIQSFKYICDYIIDKVKFRDSTVALYKYQNGPSENIISYVESFSPFKKEELNDDSKIYPQDTVTIFPSFNLPDKNSENYISSNCQSKYTLVEFWYRGCLPCMKNMNRLNEIRNSIDRSVLEIVAVNDVDDLNKDLLAFIHKFNADYIFLFNGQVMRKKLNITAHPATYIYHTKTRKVVYIKSGTCEHYSEEIISFIKKETK